MKVLLCWLFTAFAAVAQPSLGANNLNAGWLWPKGVYTLVIHDGPGPRTEEIANFLAARNMVADFFQVLCHYTGQPSADPRSAMCFQQHAYSASQIAKLQSAHQCIGNHGQDHLNTASLNQADTLYQIGGATTFFMSYWGQQDCPALLTFPGFQTDAQHNAWLNQDATTGRQQGPIWADFDGSGTVNAASGPVTVQNDQDCFTQGFSQQQCLAVMLGAMAQANHGGIVNIHDFNPYAFNPLDPSDLKSGYAYDLVAGIVSGCRDANGGRPCVWLPPDAIPGVHRAHAINQFTQISSAIDDFSDRTSGIVVGDINGDGLPDVLVPRTDGIYCALNAGNGTLYGLQRCLSFTDSSMATGHYWLVDVDGDNLPYVAWLSSSGLVGAKADGKGGFSSSTRLLCAGLSAAKLRSDSIDRESIRFGRIRPNGTVDLVAMSAAGVMVANNNGNGFDPPHRIAHLAYLGEAVSGWTPQQAGPNMVLVDLFGAGTLDIAIPGSTGLLYAKSGADSFAAFRALKSADDFDYWSNPAFYTSLNATRIAGRNVLAAWSPVGIVASDFQTVSGHATVDQFQVLCSDCFATLPGWLGTAAAFPSGFADFAGTGTPQAFAVWGSGLFAVNVNTLVGYR